MLKVPKLSEELQVAALVSEIGFLVILAAYEVVNCLLCASVSGKQENRQNLAWHCRWSHVVLTEPVRENRSMPQSNLLLVCMHRKGPCYQQSLVNIKHVKLNVMVTSYQVCPLIPLRSAPENIHSHHWSWVCVQISRHNQIYMCKMPVQIKKIKLSAFKNVKHISISYASAKQN